MISQTISHSVAPFQKQAVFPTASISFMLSVDIASHIKVMISRSLCLAYTLMHEHLHPFQIFVELIMATMDTPNNQISVQLLFKSY